MPLTLRIDLQTILESTALSNGCLRRDLTRRQEIKNVDSRRLVNRTSLSGPAFHAQSFTRYLDAENSLASAACCGR